MFTIPVGLLGDPPARMLVIFGQSNGIGLETAANVTNYPGGVTAAFPAVTLLDHNAIALADPPTYIVEGPRSLSPRTTAVGGSYTAGMGGLELTCGRELSARTSNRWFFYKQCIDGSSLINHWNNPAYPTGGPALLTNLIANVQAQVTTWGISNLAENLILVFVQGESDAGGQPYATYLAALDAMFASLRSSIGNCRIILQQLTSQNDLIGNVRAAEDSFVSGDARAALVRSDDLPLREGAPPSAKHYTDNSYSTLGVRYADAIISLVNGIAPTGPYYVGAGPITVASSVQGITPVMPRHQSGDILVFVLSALGNTNYPLTTANNFAQLFTPVHDGVALDARLQSWWVRATSSSMPAPVMADVGSDDAKIGQVHIIRGCVATGSPFTAVATATAASSTSVSVPGLTTTTPHQLVAAIAAIRVDLAVPQFTQASFANPDLASVTNQVNFESSAGAGYGLGITTGAKAVAGTVQPTTATLLNTSTQALAAVAWTAT